MKARSSTAPKLLHVQSELSPISFDIDELILLCALIGAEKGPILNKLSIMTDAFKIVFITPMKALV
ncbi:uncharacterized protein EV420DRAFT_1642592 [Desarmillaria tabescens]|uniref:Uncharacterized protein n=1 Tax=Armillaria tabescens TaxID=1929756 RepID=A0AA39KDL9_ARMTA|nr:uncharacterized protein EV420DRAFT_1642592 [Desarmillaria tabescens]KAK0458873.1 hypothetical protein EV420DRAFT_1642592 [Desarmillaria tabescens]